MGDPTRSETSGCYSPWQYLMPAEILAKVFEYLPEFHEDRLNARATCQRWHEVGVLPRFWAKGFFPISGDDEPMEGVWRFRRYMRGFGCHLKHMSVALQLPLHMSWRITHELRRNVFDELKEMFNIEQQLQSFGCLNWTQVHCYTEYGIPSSKAMIQKALSGLCQFLERQEHLSTVYFHKFGLSMEEGRRVLRALATPNTRSQMTSLTLRGFFLPGLTVSSVPVFLKVMAQFRSLARLGLSYDYLSDTVLGQLISASPALRRIYLYVDKGDIAEFSPPDWQKVVKRIPDLGMYVNINVFQEDFPYKNYLFPHLPLVALRLCLTFPFHLNYIMVNDDLIDDAIEREVASAISFTTHLRLQLFIASAETSDDALEEQQANRRVRKAWSRPEVLVGLVKTCSSLSHLCLDVTLTLGTLMEMADAALSRGEREGLEERPLNIRVTGLDTEQKRVMAKVSAVYPFFHVQISDTLYLPALSPAPHLDRRGHVSS